MRRDHAIRSTGVLIAYGVDEQGQREPLDLLVADSETEASWGGLFKRLKSRSLNGVDLVVSDAHTGLVTALKRQFQGARWQRCQVHFTRNVLEAVPRHLRKLVASKLKLIFQAEDIETAKSLAKSLMAEFDSKAEKAMVTLDEGLDQALTLLSFQSAIASVYAQRI